MAYCTTREYKCSVHFVWAKASVKDLQLQIHLVNPLEPSGYCIYHQFNIHKPHVLPTQGMYVLFCVDLRTNSDYFPIQH